MRLTLIFKTLLTYGGAVAQGKALALLLFLAAPVYAQPAAILAFGDSLTAGYGLPDGQGFVPQLQRWLTAQGQDRTVINGGVSGDTTAGGLSRIDWALSDDVGGVIVTLGGNDMLRGLDPAVTRANLSGILQMVQARGLPVLVVGMQAPGNYGPNYKAAFDAIYPELAVEFGGLYFESFFKGLGSGDPAALQALFQSDGIHPNAEGVTRIVEAMGPAVLDLIALMHEN
jgi:acyl-CoA thioesterase I